MELWIRSQNKRRLRKTDIINYNYDAGSHIVYCNGYPAGTYATKERCLEIIDEIQKLLYCDFVTVNSNNAMDLEKVMEMIIEQGSSVFHFPKETSVEYHSTVVYEMPEK